MFNNDVHYTRTRDQGHRREECTGIPSIDDFITKEIKIGSLNIKHVNRMGRYVKERKEKPMPIRVYIEEFLIANIQKYI